MKEKSLFLVKYDCKHSRRYVAGDKDFPVQDVYVKRPWSNNVEEFEMEISVPAKGE